MNTVDIVTPRRVLAVGAHPDDIEFGCGATLAKWSAAGAQVELCVLTDGSKGTWDPGADITTLVSERAAEQRHAAAVLGAADVHFVGRVDGELTDDAATREVLCRVVRAARPDVVLGHDPWKQYRLHPDHHEAGRLVIDAVVAARDPHFFPAAGRPHRPECLLLFEAQVVDHIERVGSEHVQAKIDALLAHRSQWLSTMGIAADSSDAGVQTQAFTEQIRSEIAELGGEAFKRITDL